MVSPMPNMATPKKVEVYLVVHANPSCQKKCDHRETDNDDSNMFCKERAGFPSFFH